MSNETKKLIDSIQLKDALTAVKVAMELNEVQDKTIGKIVELVGSMDQNMKLLATKVLELEQRLNVASKGIERIDERS